jgi:SagB-type dehydrogenase family enzyme
MDWANQPSPFRFYEGVDPEPLPFLSEGFGTDRPSLYGRGQGPPAALSRKTVGGFLELSLGLSAWKSTGAARWSLRINPSSGNLHPTEAHLLLPPGKGPAGVFHYNPFLHALEPRARLSDSLWFGLEQHVGAGAFLVALTSIYWRESWKYGERAFRYCQHDAGHALASAAFSAALFGWQITVLSALSDEQIERILGFDRIQWPKEEAEHPDLVFAVHPEGQRPADRGLPEAVIAGLGALPVTGRPNRLSRSPVRWPAIAEVAARTEKPATRPEHGRSASTGFAPDPGPTLSAADAIRQRRSALDFDPEFVLDRESFFAMLDKTRPRRDVPPFDAGLDEVSAQLLLFVHRVEGLDPGLYLLLRDPDRAGEMRDAMRSDFLWEAVDPDLPLFFLEPGDLRRTAMRLCCHQEIAGAGAFSLGMISRFADRLLEAPWRYRTLFMETGMIGQVLYLEAEARGIRGTGIGCYFDDAVHELAGIVGTGYQSLYHFTAGLPVADPRLRTEPPYAHLDPPRRSDTDR